MGSGILPINLMTLNSANISWSIASQKLLLGDSESYESVQVLFPLRLFLAFQLQPFQHSLLENYANAEVSISIFCSKRHLATQLRWEIILIFLLVMLNTDPVTFLFEIVCRICLQSINLGLRRRDYFSLWYFESKLGSSSFFKVIHFLCLEMTKSVIE